MDSTYMFNLEGLIPKLCQLAQEVGDDERALRLRSAGMQALANMVWFMGEQSHISMDFDNVSLLFLLLVLISVFYFRDVLLENYLDLQMKAEDGKEARQHSQSQDQWVQGVLKEESHSSSFPDMSKRVSSLQNPVANPDMYSTTLAKEATTVRRVLEPLFHHFDVENHGSSDTGVACSLILYLQLLLEESGGKSHLLLSILIKHLDHKNVAKQPRVQIHIVDIATQLAQNAKLQASVAIIGAITDLIKQLQKCLQNAAELSNAVDDMAKWNADLQYASENCIRQLSKKAFPDALFHQLLLAMAHPVHETRGGAHSVVSVVLMSSRVSPLGVRLGQGYFTSCF
ncbi:hypothetical protein Pint_07048 [Pistacia integerrima]|uniref:Uncharacterized protein n=1 Tax=Pistacia integerrima TaxID=434235 RepID=A0ACC0XTV3_9ROSI|nr:hypothetical protein Pint_07048 [Pistacia integerrima]